MGEMGGDGVFPERERQIEVCYGQIRQGRKLYGVQYKQLASVVRVGIKEFLMIKGSLMGLGSRGSLV